MVHETIKEKRTAEQRDGGPLMGARMGVDVGVGGMFCLGPSIALQFSEGGGGFSIHAQNALS